MTRRDALLRLKSRLIARRDALRKALADDVGRLREVSEVVGYGDQVDAATDSANDEICSRLAEIESRELAQLELALQRLIEGRYGRCVSCGDRIPATRLNALPYTTRCIDCQRMDESHGPARSDEPPRGDVGGRRRRAGNDGRRRSDGMGRDAEAIWTNSPVLAGCMP